MTGTPTGGAFDVDAQAQAISAGLEKLIALLQEPVAKEALDLVKNAHTSEHHTILQRLHKSLRQYLEREDDLFYIGLVGHFSSGKSSTVNSLLGTWRTSNERATGLNPTDRTITLITRKDNLNSLVGVIKEGQVTIRSEGMESAFLANLVLVDTPGLGDFELTREIARDFLPICDIILFLFSATSPLDQNDIPILSDLRQRLPFIPILFVVTRADELRVDFSKDISSENIDAARKQEFFTGVLSRINKVIEPKILTEGDFLLIDNKSRYNVDLLREILLERCNPADPRSRIVMHAHKLQYYVRAAKFLKNYFANFLTDRLKTLTRIVNTAEINIQKYNEHVRIANNSLTKTWHEQHTAIQEAREETVRRLEHIGRIPGDLAAFHSVATKVGEAHRDISAGGDFGAGRLTEEIRKEVIWRLREHLRGVEDVIARIEPDDVNLGNPRFPPFSVEFLKEQITILNTLRIARWREDLRAVERDELKEQLSKIRKAVAEATNLTQQKLPFARCDDEVRKAQESLRNDLSEFFRNVELYRDGVFSITTKELISSLGIGGKLDELESEFAETDKAAFTGEAIQKLFPDFDTIMARALTRLTEVEVSLRPLSEATRNEKPPVTEVDQDEVITLAREQAKLLLSRIIAEVQNEVDRFCNRLATDLARQLSELRVRFISEVASARTSRRNRFLSITVGGGLVGLLLYLSYFLLGQPMPQTVFATIVGGVVIGILGNAAGAGLWRVFDQFPATIKKIREKYQISIPRETRQLFDEALESRDLVALAAAELMAQLKTAEETVLTYDPDNWRERSREFLSYLNDIAEKYQMIRSEYFELSDQIVSRISTYFSDAENNLEILKNIAGSIKEKAIQPSFNLLDATRQQLNLVKTSIDNIEFA